MIDSAKLQGLYHLIVSEDRQISSSRLSCLKNSTITIITNSNICHFRLGHLSRNHLNVLHKKISLYFKLYQWKMWCDVCLLAKQRKLSFLSSINRAFKILELIHMDIWDPFSKTPIHGHNFFITIFYDYSCYTWIVLFKSKGEVRAHVRKFVHLGENQFETNIKSIRSDNEFEFLLKDFFVQRNFTPNKLCCYILTKWESWEKIPTHTQLKKSTYVSISDS